MAGWNGTGVFSRLYSWVADAAAGIDITASRMDADTDLITSAGFSNCLTRDGQGAATANLPMNGYRHTGVGNGVAATDYVALGQITPPGAPAPAFVPAAAYLGEIRATALPESLLPSLMPGWHVAAGQTRPRTDPLWVATGGVSAGNWVFGNGDGTTTYTLPDRRGRVAAGKDDMGGTPANRITSGVSGVTGTTLGASGGDQSLQAHGHTAGSVDAGHTHTATDVGHTHAATATDSGHTHPFTLQQNGGGGANGIATSIGGSASTNGVTNTGTANIGVSVSSGNANINVATGTANITTTIGSTGAGASQNVQPTLVENIVIFVGASP